MRLLLLSSIFLVAFIMQIQLVYAQQDAIHSHYMFNSVLVNPATAGLEEDRVTAMLLFKRQWVSMPSSPTGQAFSIDGPINRKKFKNKWGMRLNLVGDQFGPNKNAGVFGAVSYKMKLGKNKLAVGLRGGLKSYTIDWGKIEYASGYIAGEDYSRSTSVATMGIGAHYYSERGYIGLVIDNPTSPALKLEKGGASAYGNLYSTTLLTAGYDFRVNDKFNIQTSLLVKGANYKTEGDTANRPTRSRGDIRLNANFLFSQKYWLGLGITESGGNLLIGAKFKNQFMVGLAFNSAASGVGVSTGNTQEIVLGYAVGKKESEVKLHLVSEEGVVIMIAKKGKENVFYFDELPNQESFIFKMESDDSEVLEQTKEVEVRYKNAEGKEVTITVTKDRDEFFRYTFLPILKEEELYAINDAGDTVGVAKKNPEGYFVFEYLPNDQNLVFIPSAEIEEEDMVMSVLINDKMVKLAKGEDTYFRFEVLPPETVTLYLLGDNGDTLGSGVLNSDGFFVFEKLPIDQSYIFFLDARDVDLIDQVQIIQKDKEGKDKVLTLAKGDGEFFRYEFLEYEESRLYLIGKNGDTLSSTLRNMDGFFVFEKLPIDQNFLFMMDGEEVALIDDVLILTTDKAGNDKLITAAKDEGNLFKYESIPSQTASIPGILEPDEVAFILNTNDERILRTTYQSLKFNTGEGIIRLESYPYLEALSKMLILNADWRIVLSGFTDDVGAGNYNMLLSKQRAETVKRALVKRRVPTTQVRVKFFGESHPIASNKTEDGRQKNRRVEMRIVRVKKD